jgi:hypothetical protein
MLASTGTPYIDMGEILGFLYGDLFFFPTENSQELGNPGFFLFGGP